MSAGINIVNGSMNTLLTGTDFDDSIDSLGEIRVTIRGLGGDDKIISHGTYGSVFGDDGNDSITVTGHFSTIDGGAGNDSILNDGRHASISGGTGDDYISTQRDGETIHYALGDGNDTIVGTMEYSGKLNYTLQITGAPYTSIQSNAGTIINVGNDSILLVGATGNVNVIGTLSSGSLVEQTSTGKIIRGGNSADYISDNISNGDTVNALGGNDTIISNANNVLLDGGRGNDLFQVGGNNSTINGGRGNDTINLNSAQALIQYSSGDGNDLITGFNANSTLSISGANYSTVASGDDVIVSVGLGKITLEGANTLDDDILLISPNPSGTGIDLTNTTDHTLVTGTAYNDTIYNMGQRVTVRGLDGDDYITNNIDSSVATASLVGNFIDAGDGNDTVHNHHSYHPTILGGNGDDYLVVTYGHTIFMDGGSGNDTLGAATLGIDWAMGGYATLLGGDGNDYIDTGYTNYSTIDGGAGNDTINVLGADSTITGGTGDDRISLGTADSVNVLINYVNGDGNDLITGFNGNDTLNISGASYSTVKSGNNLIVSVGDGKITLRGAASSDSLNIVGTLSGGDDSVQALLVQLDEMILKRTEAGYPVIAGQVFSPEDYIGTEPTNYASKENWSITSKDGLKLNGIHYTPENSNDKWVVIVHGYGNNHTHMYSFAEMYLANGYNVLLIDQRAAGDSEGTWLTMGAAESSDLALWTQEIARRNSKAKITLFGVSMGAATAILAAARSDIKNVTSLVDDCGYTNMVEVVTLLQKNNPIVNSLLPVELIPALDITAASLTGYKLSQADPIDSISAAKLPTLFIAGTNDTVVPMTMLTSLYDASGATVKETFIVDGATHALAAAVDPVGYSNTMFRFIAEADGEGWLTSNATSAISLRGTRYADTITTSGNNVTVNTGAGNDIVNNSGSKFSFVYEAGDGNDLITGFNSTSTLSITGGSYNSVKSGNDVILNVGSGKITLNGAASLRTLNIIGTSDGGLDITNITDDTLITGTADNDTIYNLAQRVTVRGLSGDDYIVNNIDSSVTVASEVGNLIEAGDGNDTVFSYHSYHPTIYGGNGNDSIIVRRGHMTFIDAGDGNDSIIGWTADSLNSDDWTMGGYATLLGGAGNDYIAPFYTNNASINGGSGNDTINMMGADSTITGGTGDDRISLGTADSVNVLINYVNGDGNDLITGFNENDTLSISGTKYSSVKSGSDIILFVGDGNLTLKGANTLSTTNIIGSYDEASDSVISNSTNRVSLTGTAGNDTIANTGNYVTIQGMAGDDSINNSAANALIFGNAGADLIRSSGSSVSVYGGDGNDTIYNSGAGSYVDGGSGTNYISLSGSQGMFVALEGRTTVDGFNTGFGDSADSVYVASDPAVDFKANGLTFYDGTDSLTLHDVNDTAKVYLYYAAINKTRKGIFIASDKWYTVTNSDLTVKSNEGVYFVGTSSGVNHGVDFSNISQAIDVTLNTDYNSEVADFWVNNVHSIRGGAGSTKITGSDKADTIIAGRGATTINAGAGNDRISVNSASAYINYRSGDGNDLITGFNANSTLNITGSEYFSLVSGNDVLLSVGDGLITLSGAADLTELNIRGTEIDFSNTYIGGDATIPSYAGQAITFDDTFVASAFSNGDFFVMSSTGTLVIEDVEDQIIDLRDGNGNVFVKAYTPSQAGLIDGRGISGIEIIEGSSAGTDVIFAGDGGSSLWGGSGTDADALVGGGGTDIFVVGQAQGNDNIFNASSTDLVSITDANLSDIVATLGTDSGIAIGFNTGTVINIQSTDTLSAAVNLADGSSWRFNHSTKTWQNA